MTIHEFNQLLEFTAQAFEIVAVGVLVLGFLISAGRYLSHYRDKATIDLIQEFKCGLGRSVLIGLEIQVAATIVKTVAQEATLTSMGLLAGMIIIRTMLSWTMVLELEGHWPWQSARRLG